MDGWTMQGILVGLTSYSNTHTTVHLAFLKLKPLIVTNLLFIIRKYAYFCLVSDITIMSRRSMFITGFFF